MKVMASYYIHKVHSDLGKILSCEAPYVANQAAEKLKSTSTPFADDLELLYEDEHSNLIVSFKIQSRFNYSFKTQFIKFIDIINLQNL